MSQEHIKQLIESRVSGNGLFETGVPGVQLFRVTDSIRCAPAIYEPTVVAIVSGTKEAILDGQRHIYDSSRYLCCTMSMPVEAGTPAASPDNPLLGVTVSLDTRVMTELAIAMESATGAIRKPGSAPPPTGPRARSMGRALHRGAPAAGAAWRQPDGYRRPRRRALAGTLLRGAERRSRGFGETSLWRRQ